MMESSDAREAKLRFAKHYERAQGWLLLEKYDFAVAALDQIPPPYGDRVEVIKFRCGLLLEARHWEPAAAALRQLLGHEPEEAGHWVNLAYATRRAESIPAAEKVLREAGGRFPQVAVIWYNLACYASQQRQFPEAAELLKKAAALDPKYEQLAREDPDFEPYWKQQEA